MRAYVSRPMPESFFQTSEVCLAPHGESEIFRPYVNSKLYRGVAVGFTLELFTGFLFYGLWEFLRSLR